MEAFERVAKNILDLVAAVAGCAVTLAGGAHSMNEAPVRK